MHLLKTVTTALMIRLLRRRLSPHTGTSAGRPSVFKSLAHTTCPQVSTYVLDVVVRHTGHSASTKQRRAGAVLSARQTGQFMAQRRRAAPGTLAKTA